MRMKSVLIGFLLLFVLIVYFPDLSPVEYKDSSSWSFILEEVVVNGSNLGSYHSVEEGDMVLTGEIWTFMQRKDHTDEPEPVLISVYEESNWWVDRKVGSIKMEPSPTLNEAVEFSIDLGPQPKGSRYYFVITRYTGNNDGWGVKGSGNIYLK